MDKRYRLIWSISLLVINIITITSVAAGSAMPDTVKRVLGVIDLIAIPVLIWSSIKLRMLKKADE